MNHVHDLEAIYWTTRGGVQEVVRWCKDCGAVVVDADVDGRVYPGNIMKMRFPAMNKPRAEK